MPIKHVVLMFTGMLLVAVVVHPLARRFSIPFSALLVAVGFIGSEIITGAGIDTGLRWHHFHDLVFFVFLPGLVFEAAFRMDLRLLRANLAPVLLLAIPVTVLTTAISAALMFYGIGYEAGFPWVAALLAAAILAATDPVAVLDLFREANASKRLNILVEGESLFNDATAIVLFTLLLGVALGTREVTAASAVLDFIRIFFGGALMGTAVGVLALSLLHWIRGVAVHGVISLISAYIAFVVAEGLFHVSGVIAVLAAGMLIGHGSRMHAVERERYFLNELWEFIAYIANALVFLLMGFSVTLGMFETHWLAMLIAIAAVFIARAVGVFGTAPFLTVVPGVAPISSQQQMVMVWGGLRGGVALALVLSLPTELPFWYTIQAMVYGVVLFTLFVQAPTMPLLLAQKNR